LAMPEMHDVIIVDAGPVSQRDLKRRIQA